MRKHLAIFKGDLAEKILSGEKTIESRFSKAKLSPFGVIGAGDLVYIKPTGKDIIGQFRVKKVYFFDGLETGDIKWIKEAFGEGIAADEEFWRVHKGAKYFSIIFIGPTTRFMTSPVKFEKRDLRGWVVID